MASSAKNRSKQWDQNPQKRPWNYRPYTLLPKPLCTADPKITGCFSIQISFLWCLICVSNYTHMEELDSVHQFNEL